MAREMRELGLIDDLVSQAGWKVLREEALKKVDKHEESVMRLLFRTRTAVDPIEVEYDRGFRQGVMFVLDGLPNTLQAEFQRRLKNPEERG